MVRAAVCGTEGRQFESVPVYQKMNKEKKLQASLPKGFKDRWGEELNLKNKLVDTIKDVFINYSFEQLETPEFEKSENIGSFLAEDGIRDCLWSRGLGDVYKRQDRSTGSSVG